MRNGEGIILQLSGYFKSLKVLPVSSEAVARQRQKAK